MSDQRVRRRRIARRILWLTGVVVATLAVAVGALALGRFSDDDGSVHEEAIEAIAAEGITRGCNPPDNTLFCPEDVVTRGQMAAFLVRALSLPATDDDFFTDDDGSVFDGDINRLAAAGVTQGCNPPDNTLFCPDDVVTRGQMAAFLRRGFDYPVSTEDFFSDDDGSVFEADIQAIAAAGVTRGCNPPDNTRFCPTDPVLRGQMASFLARALDLDTAVPEPAASCDVSEGTVVFEDVEVDLEGDGSPETIGMSVSSSSAELAVSGEDGMFSHSLTSLESLGPNPAGSRTVADVTGDGLPDVLACVRATPNVFFADVVVISADGGFPRVVLDSPLLTRGTAVADPGWVALSETESFFAGQCVFTEMVTYTWNGAIFAPVDGSVRIDTNEIDDCDGLISQVENNVIPTVGFRLGFTDRGVVEGGTLLVEGPDAGPLVVFCEGPGSFCDARSADPDGTIIDYTWSVNGRVVPWEAPGLMEMSLFEDGLNTVTLNVGDDAGARVTAVAYVDRQRS